MGTIMSENSPKAHMDTSDILRSINVFNDDLHTLHRKLSRVEEKLCNRQGSSDKQEADARRIPMSFIEAAETAFISTRSTMNEINRIVEILMEATDCVLDDQQAAKSRD